MIGTCIHTGHRRGLSCALATAVLLAMLCAVTSLYAQQGWRNTPVVSQLWLGQPMRIDNSAMPTVAITPGGVTYIAFSLEGGGRHYYTKDFPARFGIFTGFSPIYRSGGSTVRNFSIANLLAIDSASTLHYVTTSLGTDTCLEYSSNLDNDTILTGFSYLRKVGGGTCGGGLGGVSIAADAAGNLHMVGIVNGEILYFRRSTGRWSDGLLLSDPAQFCSAPAIAVTPAGEVHATFLARRASDAKESELFYVRGVGSTFDRPVSLARRDGAEWDGVAPLVLDRHGFVHVAFADQSTGTIPSLKYVSNVGGTWNSVETVLEDSRYAFGDLSLACDRYGAVHVAAQYSLNQRDSLSDGEVLHVSNANGSWSSPANVTANTSHDQAVNQGNGFMALHDSLIAVVYTTEMGTGNHSVGTARHILNFEPILALPADTIDLGTHYATAKTGEPESLTADLAVLNGGQLLYEPLRLTGVKVLEAEPGTLSLTHDGMPDPIRGGEGKVLPVSLVLPERGSFSARLEVTSNGGVDTIVVMGKMLDQLPGLHTLRLDTTHADVGSIARLTGSAYPPIQSAEGVSSLSLHLTFNADALFPKRILLADQTISATPVMSYDGKGNLDITITTSAGSLLHGESIFFVEFEGLLTGEPENDVQLEVESGQPRFVASTRPGLVLLSGCEVAKDLKFVKGGFAERIAPNPVRDVLSFRYLAPPDVRVSVDLVDLLGTGHLETELPAGTGEVQDARVDLRLLASGLYFVRLRVGERVVTDTMIKE